MTVGILNAKVVIIYHSFSKHDSLEVPFLTEACESLIKNGIGP